MALTLVFVPGYRNSGPGHWQRLWQQRYRGSHWVEQRDWEQPQLTDWVAGLQQTVTAVASEVLLVAHSLGCLTVAHWAAAHHSDKVCGALLVAPPDLQAHDSIVPQLREFALPDADALPFPSLLVASDNDPYCHLDSAKDLALAWDSEFVNVGAAGHINVASGHGSWLQGELLLRRLIESSAARLVPSRVQRQYADSEAAPC